MKNSAKTSEIDRTVAMIDETRASEHFRNPDRPNPRFVKTRRRQDPAVRRAKARLRTAAYRNRLDQRRAPPVNTIGMALVTAFVTSSMSSMTDNDWNLVGRAMVALQHRGFDLAEVKDALRRFKARVVDRKIDSDHTPVVTPDPESIY